MPDILCGNNIFKGINSLEFDTVDGNIATYSLRTDLNLAFGKSAPADTNKIWINRSSVPSKVRVCSSMPYDTTNVRYLLEEQYYYYKDSACDVVGDNVYFMGGTKQGGAVYQESCALDTIVVLNLTSKNTSVLNVTLPAPTEKSCACANGTKIYLFGGVVDGENVDTILVFDTESHTISVSNETLPARAKFTQACAVGTNIYLFGGDRYDENGEWIDDRSIWIFDTVTESMTTCSAVLPYVSWWVNGVAVDTDIYLFGASVSKDATYKNVMVLDTLTNELSIRTSYNIYGSGPSNLLHIGKYIFLFNDAVRNGQSGSIGQTVYIYDPEKDVFTKTSYKVGNGSSWPIKAIYANNQVWMVYTENAFNVKPFFCGYWMPSLTLVLNSSTKPRQLLDNSKYTIDTGIEAAYSILTDGSLRSDKVSVFEDGAWTAIQQTDS